MFIRRLFNVAILFFIGGPLAISQTNDVPFGYTATITVEVEKVLSGPTTDAGTLVNLPDIRLLAETIIDGTTYAATCSPSSHNNVASYPYTLPTPLFVGEKMYLAGEALPDNIQLRYDNHEDDSNPFNCTYDSGDDFLCNSHTLTNNITDLTNTTAGGSRIKNMSACGGVNAWSLSFRLTATFTPVPPTKIYTGPSGGTWNDTNNWTPVGIPTAVDDILIDHGGSVILDNSSTSNRFEARSLLLTNSSSLFCNQPTDSLIIDGTGAQYIDDGIRVEAGSQIINQGYIEVSNGIKNCIKNEGLIDNEAHLYLRDASTGLFSFNGGTFINRSAAYLRLQNFTLQAVFLSISSGDFSNASCGHITTDSPIGDPSDSFINNGTLVTTYDGNGVHEIESNNGIIHDAEGKLVVGNNTGIIDLNPQANYWMGCQDTTWENVENWSQQRVPQHADSVIVLDQLNQPSLSVTTPDLMHVEIIAGATLTLSGTSKLNIDGTPSSSQLLGISTSGNLILSSLSDTINVRNTTSDGLFLRSGSSLTNNGVIITDQTNFAGIHFLNGTSFVNNGEFWIHNDKLFLDGTVTFVNNGLIDVSDSNTGIMFRNFNTSINQLQNFGEVRLKNTTTSLTGANIGGDFINEQCGILTVSDSFGAGINAITNNGLIHYTATTNNHDGTYTDNGFQYDPNGQLPDGNSYVLSSPLNEIQFNYNLDGDGTSLCEGDFPDDLPAANDVCATAIDYESAFGPIPNTVVCGGTSLDFTAYGDGGFDPTCDTGNDATAWYTWTATDSILSFLSGTGAPGLEVLEGSCGGLSSLGCFNNASGTISGLTIGNPYYLLIWDDHAGAADVDWILTTGMITYDMTPTCGDTLDYPACDVLYPNNDNQTFTICPILDADTASITFTFFDIEAGFDFVEIFDNGVSLGSFSGLGLTDSTFTAADTGHCLEVVFTSDFSVGKTGFTFVVNCGISNDTCGGAYPYESVFGPIGAEGSCPSNMVSLDMSNYTDAGRSTDGAPTCDGSNDAAAWYTWTATSTAIRFTSGLGAPGLEILEGSCGSFTSLGCLENENGTIGDLTIGQTYYIVIWDNGTPGASEVTWCIEEFLSCQLLVFNTLDSGFGSFRDAVACAMSGDTIRFDDSINGDSIKLTSGQIIIDKDLTILGNGRDNTIIDGSLDDAARLFRCNSGNSIEIRNLTMQHGGGATFTANNQLGGAIQNYGQLKLINCLLQKNMAFVGGAIESAFNANRLKILNCEIVNNVALLQSGAINLFDGEGAIFNSNFYKNSSGNARGGIFIFGTAQAKIVNTTITDNVATNGGGGLSVNGAGSDVQVLNSIISGNSSGSPDLEIFGGGTVSVFQNNILGSTVGNSLVSGFILGYPAFVDTANNNYQLLAHSIGIDGGDNAFIPADSCDVDGDGNTTELLPIDLAGYIRSLRCNVDIGAYEFGAATFCPAVNDLCTGAFELGCDTTFSIDPSLATDEGQPGAETCFGTLNGLWYRFIGTGDSVLISASGSGPGIQVFRGGCDSLSCLAGNFTNGLNLDLGFQSVLGEDYLIYIDGSFDMMITATLSCIDDCPAIRTVAGTPTAGSYFAENEINSNATIESPKGVIYQAGEEILLNQGFEVELGAEFDALIGPCP